MFRNRRNLFEVLLLKNNEQHLYIRDTRLFKDGQIIFFFVLKNVVLLCIEKIDGNKLYFKNWCYLIYYTLFKFQCFILPLRLFDYSCTLTVIKISRKNARLGTWNQSTYHHTQSAFHVRKFPWRPSSVYKYVEKKPWRVSIPAVSVYIVQNIRFKYRLEDV